MDGVRRIESATHAGLQDDDVDLFFRKIFQSKRGNDFKKRRMRVPIGNETANCRQAICDRVLRNHFAIDGNTFAKRDEVRGCE